MKKIILPIILITLTALAFAAAPVVNNVVATPGTGKVTITYSLTAEATCDVRVVVSNDGGGNYNIYPTALSGDFGHNVPNTPTAKTIIWNPAADDMTVGSNYKVKVIARDNPNESSTQVQSFLKVEGGTFSRQNSDGTYPNPAVMVTLSSFYIDKYEITQAEYEAVMGINPSYFTSVTNGPVEQVTWFNPIEYCNRRSLQEGLTPCYSYSTYGTNPDDWPSGWNTSDANHTNVSCNWSATGYRLPTEMEWMFAARGGNQSLGYTYSGSNTIGDVAWYTTNSGSTTHEVGTKAANELGLYDLSGNVWEWNWDIYGDYPTNPPNNPTGASSGSYRVVRGGDFYYDAAYCTVFYRYSNVPPYSAGYNIGFRVCRVSP